MEINKLYIQRHSDMDIYVMPTRKLKNGGYYGLIFHHYDTRCSGKVKKGSLAHMYPVPSLVSGQGIGVPDAIWTKFGF